MSASFNPVVGEGEQGESLRAIHELTNNYFATEFTVNAEGILSQIHELSRAPSSTVAGAQGAELLVRIDSAINRITSGQAAMRIPAQMDDPDLVLRDCKQFILQSQKFLGKPEPSADK